MEEGICDISESRTWGGRRSVDRIADQAVQSVLIIPTVQCQSWSLAFAKQSFGLV